MKKENRIKELYGFFFIEIKSFYFETLTRSDNKLRLNMIEVSLLKLVEERRLKICYSYVIKINPLVQNVRKMPGHKVNKLTYQKIFRYFSKEV